MLRAYSQIFIVALTVIGLAVASPATPAMAGELNVGAPQVKRSNIRGSTKAAQIARVPLGRFKVRQTFTLARKLKHNNRVRKYEKDLAKYHTKIALLEKKNRKKRMKEMEKKAKRIARERAKVDKHAGRLANRPLLSVTGDPIEPRNNDNEPSTAIDGEGNGEGERSIRDDRENGRKKRPGLIQRLKWTIFG